LRVTGVTPEYKNYRLPKSLVPEDYVWLNEMFLNYRGNFIAHSNFKTLKPIVGQSDEVKDIPITYTDIGFDHWFQQDDEFPDAPLLIDEAQHLVTALINEIYPEGEDESI
jgi:hypothetical protein